MKGQVSPQAATEGSLVRNPAEVCHRPSCDAGTINGPCGDAARAGSGERTYTVQWVRAKLTDCSDIAGNSANCIIRGVIECLGRPSGRCPVS